MKKEWYSTGEAAARLGVSDRYVREWIEEGKLDARRFIGGDRPGAYRIQRAELERFERDNFRWSRDG